MKRTILVVSLATVMLFAFTASAFAVWGGYGTGNPTGTPLGTQRETSEYVNWAAVSAGTYGNAGIYGTPHKGYDTNTTLCAVCHSVHFAPVWEGAPAGGVTHANFTAGGGVAAATSEKLLRTTVGNACTYCHIDSSIGGIQIYAGDRNIYGTTAGNMVQNFENAYAHDFHGTSGKTGCLVCHSVHGANTYDGAVASKILNRKPGAGRDRDPQPEVIGELTNAVDPSTGVTITVTPVYATLAAAYSDNTDRFKQQVAFCSSCHWTYSDDSYQAHQKRTTPSDGTGAWVKNHPLVEADGVKAFVGSGTCRSCHDAGGVNQNDVAIGDAIDNLPASGFSSNNFPHYTGGNYRFLKQDSTDSWATDQSCLKCHRDGASTGVGITY